jgi:putative membrane protein
MKRRDLLFGAATATLLTKAGKAEAQRAREPTKLAALRGGDFATITSRLARQRSRSAAVRTFAGLEINEQAAVAAAFGSRPGAAGVNRRHAALIAQLRGLSGPAFDAAYIEGQIIGHGELLAIHRRYARVGADRMARGASIVAVPAIETHLAMLITLRRTMV